MFWFALPTAEFKINDFRIASKLSNIASKAITVSAYTLRPLINLRGLLGYSHLLRPF